jgi:hypothetical protein
MLAGPLHDGMPFDIDAAPSSSAGDLGVLASGEGNTRLTIELF